MESIVENTLFLFITNQVNLILELFFDLNGKISQSLKFKIDVIKFKLIKP